MKKRLVGWVAVLALLATAASQVFAHTWNEAEFASRPLYAYPIPRGQDEIIGSLTTYKLQPGDTLLALPSAGLHTNGYSLARKLVFEVAKLKPDTYVAEVGNKIGAELLKPHLCYAAALKNIVARGWVSALAHITGGGIPGNLPRVLPSGVKAQIDLSSWPVPPIFKYLARIGKIDTGELLQSFNMGVGMILVVPPKHVKVVEADLKRRREKFFLIGRIERSDSGKARVHFSGSLNL